MVGIFCYQVFSKMVANGKLPDTYASLVEEFELEDEIIAEADLEDNINEIELFTALQKDDV